MEGDANGELLAVQLPLISTHAPAWGRQQLEAVLGGLIVISTHAPTWGGDGQPDRLFPAGGNFYSRPRVGATPPGREACRSTADFYSRPREGGDTVTDVDRYVAELFLLTPPRGGRRLPQAKRPR